MKIWGKPAKLCRNVKSLVTHRSCLTNRSMLTVLLIRHFLHLNPPRNGINGKSVTKPGSPPCSTAEAFKMWFNGHTLSSMLYFQYLNIDVSSDYMKDVIMELKAT